MASKVAQPSVRPKLLRQYTWWLDPVGADGVEGLHFASAQRRLRIAGRSLHEFARVVFPLLDGRHTVEEIAATVAPAFGAAVIGANLGALAEQRVVEFIRGDDTRVDGTHAFFHELGLDARQVTDRLTRSTVVVLGLTDAGLEAASRLEATGVGTVRRMDGDAAGADDMRTAIRGADFVVCALDVGMASLIYRLNRACLAERIPWTLGTLAGAEVILGPTVTPHETACFTCYRMRSIACAMSPEQELALERVLDGRKHDDSATRENTALGSGLLGNLLGLEALKALSGVVTPSALGSIVITDLVRMTTTRHVVLRKPWCPDCFPSPEGT